MKLDDKEYPLEYFVPLTGHEYLLGRITVAPIFKLGRPFYHLDVDIVQKESKKIYRHITMFDCDQNESEAIDLAMQKLSDFVRER